METLGSVLNLPMTDIFVDEEFNCRGHIVPVHVYELAKDIREHGLLQNIVVQPWDKDGFKYRIVCGHRRYMAYRINEETHIPGTVKEGLTEEDAMAMNLSENLCREDLNLLQEAKAIEKFINFGWSTKRICKKLSVSEMWLRARTALLQLEPEIQKRAEAGLLTQHQIMDISRMPTAKDRMAATQKAVNHKLAGERKSLKLKESKSVFTKKPRAVEEIHEMQGLVADVLGNGLTTRFAAWAAGVISDRDFHKDIRKAADSRGISWELPMAVAPPSA